MSINKILLGGRLCRDVEVKDIGNDKHVAELSVAVDCGWGESKKTAFVDVVCWNSQAQFVAKYFKKGSGIYIDGRIEMDTWQDKESGKKRTKLKVVAEKVTFPIGGKSSEPNNSEPIPMDQKKWDTEEPPF
jgi:single-strand DNA-binding protein